MKMPDRRIFMEPLPPADSPTSGTATGRSEKEIIQCTQALSV